MEDCINLEELSLVDYLRQSEERLLKSAWRRRNRSEVNILMTVREESTRKW